MSHLRATRSLTAAVTLWTHISDEESHFIACGDLPLRSCHRRLREIERSKNQVEGRALLLIQDTEFQSADDPHKQCADSILPCNFYCVPDSNCRVPVKIDGTLSLARQLFAASANFFVQGAPYG